MFPSIKGRVAAFNAIVLLLVLTVLGVLLYTSLQKIVYDALDNSLLTKAKALGTLVGKDKNEVEFDFSDEVMWEYSSPSSKSFFQIRRADGAILEKSASLGDSVLPWRGGKASPRFQTISLKGAPTRLVNLEIDEDVDDLREANRPAKPWLIIQCAENMQAQVSLLHDYRFVLIVALVGIMLVSAAGGRLIAAKALAPIEEMSETAGRISETNLAERLSVEKIPSELKVLAMSFNRTFDRLEKAFQRQRQFMADASHELKTPLSVIQSQSEITLRKERTAAEYRAALSAVLDAGKRMSDLVRKFLTIASFSTEKAQFELHSIDAAQTVEEAVKLLKPIAEQAGIRLTASVPGPAFIRGNKETLLEALVNVIDNAVKYNHPQGYVSVSLSRNGGWVVTTVEDSGTGIPEDDLNKVFDRFYRVDKSRSRQAGGSGLGLSIANEVIELHGGRIELGSQLGVGTTVFLYLPEADYPQAHGG